MFDELIEQTAPAQPEPSAQPEVQQAPPETEREHNMRRLRERAESSERQIAELQNYIRNQQQAQQPQPKPQVDEEEIHLDDDGYIEGKQFKKYVNTLKNELRQTKKQFEEFTQRSSQSSAEVRLQTKYNDFDKVVSQENIQKLAQLKPSLYNSIKANPDLYEKGETAYELIKSYIATDRYEAVEKKIDDTRSKPRSAATVSPQVGETPLASVGDYDRRVLTEERKEQLRRQVRDSQQYRQ